MGMSYKDEKIIKYCIASSLLNLMKKYSFDEITVSEICYNANVARPTYYNYVSGKHGKEELLAFKISREFDEYAKTHPSDPDGGERIFEFVYDNKEVFRLLHKNDLNNVIIDFLYHVCKISHESKMLGIMEGYIEYYVAFSYLGTMTYWDMNDYKQTPDEISSYIRHKYSEVIEAILKKRAKNDNKP